MSIRRDRRVRTPHISRRVFAPLCIFALALSFIPGFISEAMAQAVAPEQVTLTGIVRDFPELRPKETEGHPDFNPNWDALANNGNGQEGWGCFDRYEAAKGAVQTAIAMAPANPDGVAGLLPFDRDEATPALKPGFDVAPNCFRSRFGDWYTTRTPDINRAFFLDLPFTKTGNVYTYDNAEFFPVNDALVGGLKPQVPGVTTTFGHRQSGLKDGIDLGTRNYGFTFEFHAHFTYKKNTGQKFAFRGDDDVWVFINDKLVIDLGGIHSAEYAEVDIDNLGLTDGSTYFLDFYFAERRIVSSRLTITTSLVLKNSDEPVDPVPVKALEGWLYDRNGDGIADKAEIALDKKPSHGPNRFELNLEGETERGNWNVTSAGETLLNVLSNGQFFTKAVTGWDESLPGNQGVALADPATGLLPGTFVLHDRIGPVIDKAVKTIIDTSLSEIPTHVLVIRFSEPVKVDAASVFQFLDPAGLPVQVDLTTFRPDSLVNGLSRSWTFDISPNSPVMPSDKYKVAIAKVESVRDLANNPAHLANPFKPIEAKLPTIFIGDLRAEKNVTVQGYTPLPGEVKNPFVLLTSKEAVPGQTTYVPLHPETAEDWIRRSNAQNAVDGLVVFQFKLSHPARLKLTLFNNTGHFVNEAAITITKQDLLSGKLARDPQTRAFVLRFAWFPVSKDGQFVANGAYILRSKFTYGSDPKDFVDPGSQNELTRFGFLRGGEVRGLGNP
jgi:fibro-slime domain-containing protein